MLQSRTRKWLTEHPRALTLVFALVLYASLLDPTGGSCACGGPAPV